MKKFLKGHKKFKEVKFQEYENDFESLVKNGQKPEALFIGCSDSRVTPSLIVDSAPGDMFILRNIGNFVPPYTNDKEFHSSSAVIEYAVSVLNVKSIIVCGHSHCGACASLYDETLAENKDLQHVVKWLELGSEAKNYVLSNTPNLLKEKDKQENTEKTSIIFQLRNLLTYPAIKEKYENNKIDLFGWYYKIEDGTLEEFNPETDKFDLLN